MTPRKRDYRPVAEIICLTLLFELLTIVLRFGLQFDSTRDTASTIGVLTFGVRIHHGYCGALIVLVAWGISREAPRLARYGTAFGWALIFSDLVHHFLVLWLVTGSPQFDLFYPAR